MHSYGTRGRDSCFSKPGKLYDSNDPGRIWLLELMMTGMAQVLTTVNAPYGADLSAHQLASMIADPKSVSDFNAPVFAFFSEAPPALQKEFIENMGVDREQACKVAGQFSEASGYTLPLAA
jgi:hypothetical protein